MEKRLMLAIVLSILFFIGFQLLFVKPKPQTAEAPALTPPAVSQTGTQPGGQAAPPSSQAKPIGQAAPAPDLKATGAKAEREVVVETSLYRAVWTNKGGVLKSWKLKKHLNEKKEPLEIVPVQAQAMDRFPFSLATEDRALSAGLNAALFEASKSGVDLKDGQAEEVRFSYSDGKSLRAEKIIRFTGGTYEVGIELHVMLNGQETAPALIWGPGLGNPTPEEIKKRITSVQGAAFYSGEKSPGWTRESTSPK